MKLTGHFEYKYLHSEFFGDEMCGLPITLNKIVINLWLCRFVPLARQLQAHLFILQN